MQSTKRARVVRGARPLTAAEREAELARVLAASVPRPVEPVPLDDLADADLIRQVETRRVHRYSADVFDWVEAALAGTPLRQADAAGKPVVGTWLVDALPLWVECGWLVRVTWPELFEDRPDVEVVAPRTEDEAAHHGLSVRRPHRPRGRHRKPTMPGCQGGFLAGPGQVCPNLRVTGHEFCPTCELALGE